jgi:hypothetical protein
VLNQREEKLGAHLIEGKVIHCLLLEPEKFNEKFMVSPLSLPSENSKAVIDKVFQHAKQNMLLDSELKSLDSVIIDILKEANLHQSLKTDEQRVDKIVTDQSSVFERSFPIQLSSFEFKLDNKSVVYRLKAKTVSEEKALGPYRGYILDNTTLQGKTVKEMLVGKTSDSTNDSTKGLVEYLNDHQQHLLAKGAISVKDTYTIEFEDNSGIPDATMLDIDLVSNNNAPNTSVKKGSDVNEKNSQKSNVIDKSVKVLPINRGEHILTVIDQIITGSSYVANALSTKTIEKVNRIKDTDVNFVPGNDQLLSWYSVIPNVTLGDYDEKRNTFACKIGL